MNPAPLNNTIETLFVFVIHAINVYLVPLIFALAFIYFLWGAFRFFIAGRGNEESVEKGKDFFVWSIVGFVVMLSIWGIVNLVINTLPINNNTQPDLPLFRTAGSATDSKSSGTVSPSTSKTGVKQPTSTGNTKPYNPNDSLDCRSDGMCPTNMTCQYTGPQAGDCLIDNPTDCRISTNACSSGYTCNQSTGICKLTSI